MSDGLYGLRFPIGGHVRVARFERAEVDAHIREIEAFPARLRERLERLSSADLEKRYRPGRWTVRQVIHHLYDSHTHSYIRFKWSLTEDRPLIKAYFEDRWADLPDSLSGPVELSLRGLEALHARWGLLLRSMDESAFGKSFLHPETGREEFLYDRLACYGWDGRHHLAHIESALRS